ncbi:hypothetical protein [Streptomyces niveus]
MAFKRLSQHRRKLFLTPLVSHVFQEFADGNIGDDTIDVHLDLVTLLG